MKTIDNPIDTEEVGEVGRWGNQNSNTSMIGEEDIVDGATQEVKPVVVDSKEEVKEGLKVELPDGFKCELYSWSSNIDKLCGLAVWLKEQFQESTKEKNGGQYVG